MTPQVEVSNFLTPLIKAIRVINSELDNFLENGLSEYLQSQTEKYYFTNTFIHRGEKVRFKDVYYTIKAKYRHLITDFNNIEETLEEYKCITIVGSAGSGKSTLIRHIFLQSIEIKRRIPLLIELRNLNEFDGDFEDLISEKVLGLNVKPSKDIFKRTLRSGNFLFLLDGYDEIFSIKKQKIKYQIEMFVDTYSQNRYVITTRKGGGIENSTRFHDFQVCPLDDNDVNAFISKVVTDIEKQERVSEIVKDPKNQNYMEFLRNPLLLSMFILAFENHPEIPSRKSAFYRNVFDTLYSKHDGITKNSFPREKLTQLQRDDFEDILTSFCYVTLVKGKYIYTQEYLFDILRQIKANFKHTYDIDKLLIDLETTI